MTISLHACLQDAIGIVDPAGVSLKAKEHLARGSRAVNATHDTLETQSQRGLVGGRSATIQGRSESLQASEVVAMDVAQEACQGRAKVRA